SYNAALNRLRNQYADHRATVAGYERDRKAFESRRDAHNLNANRLKDEKEALRQRVAAFNQKSSGSGKGPRIGFDDDAPKGGLGGTRKARDEARRAEEQRKRLAKQFGSAGASGGTAATGSGSAGGVRHPGTGINFTLPRASSSGGTTGTPRPFA